MKLLVVDDDENVRELLRDILQSQSNEVFAVATVQEAASRLDESDPDLVILDRNLPDGDGIEFCRWLRQSEKWRKTPVLLISSLKSFEDVAAGLDAGGTHYMAKPFDLGELGATVERLFAGARPELPPAGFMEAPAS